MKSTEYCVGALPSGITNYKVLGDPFNLILILTNHINNYNSLAWLELGHLLTEFQPLLLASWSGLSSKTMQSSPPPRDQQTSASTVERYKLEWGMNFFTFMRFSIKGVIFPETQGKWNGGGGGLGIQT